MRTTRWLLAAGLIAAAGCGAGGDAVQPSDTGADSVPIGSNDVDLAEGAFNRNDGNQSASGAPEDAALGNDEESTLTPTSGGVGADDPTADDPAADDPAADDPSASDPAADDPTGSDPPGTTTVVPSGGEGSLGPMQGLVRIGTVSYPFEPDTCEYDEEYFFAFGYGTSSDGAPVQVSIIYEAFDFNDDGSDEISLDIAVESDAPVGTDLTTLPDFYATKIESDEFAEGEDISVSLQGERITGDGPITDLNGVVADAHVELPMTFDVQCA